jgi:endoglycosylceramidase
MLTFQTSFYLGFNTVPGGNLYANLSVLSYHWYCTILSIFPSFVTSAVEARVSCNPQGDVIFQTVKNDIQQTGGSSFLTEFGFDPTTDSGAQQNYFVMDKCDQYFQSWTVWGVDFIDGSGNIEYNILSQFNRPYAYAIAGTPQLMFYDHNHTYCFTLKYIIDLTINCPSEIYLPSTIYPSPNGYNITLTCGLQSSIDLNNTNVINIYTTNSTTNGCLGIVCICPT